MTERPPHLRLVDNIDLENPGDQEAVARIVAEADNVIDLAEHRPHLEGTGFCLQCRHSWVAVAPLGTTRLECPSCGTYQGVWRGTFDAQEGEMKFICVCGNDLFLIQPHRIMCAACGTCCDPRP